MPQYTYTIFDGDPAVSGPCQWPSHEDVEVTADDAEGVLAEARDEAEIHGEPGDTLWILVRDQDGVIAVSASIDVPEDAHEVSSRVVDVIDIGGCLYRLADLDEIDEPTHESAEEWYDSLGYHVSAEDGDHAHPVCSLDEVDTYEPQSDAEASLLEYARAARDAATAVESALERAVTAWRDRDLAACIEALDEASQVEREYGDDPAAQALRDQLLVEVE